MNKHRWNEAFLEKEYLDEALAEYSRTDYYPFHMPGHKRQPLGSLTPEEIDITEIDGFDNLHHAEGILRTGQKRLARVFGADESFFLVNGSTAGLLAAISGVTRKGDRILIARNCHKAVYHAACLMELLVEYVYPEPTEFGIQGHIEPAQVERMLEQYPDIRAVVITSPTYDGVVSDIQGIAEAVHGKNIPLIVDEAHGAHFGFSEDFPEKAIACGADLCIESLHKTLPCYTQTAVLHAVKTHDGTWRFDPDRIKRYLGIYQTSSPSYIFMAGIDRCVRMLQQEPEAGRFPAFGERLRRFYANTAALPGIQIYNGEEEEPGIFRKDASKILISASALGLNGQELYEILLRKYHLQMEMASGHYVTALTTIMDTQEGFDRLEQALQEISGTYALEEHTSPRLTPLELYQPQKRRYRISQAMDAETETVSLEASAGCVAADFLYLYPPGIPLVAPGEIISPEAIHCLQICGDMGLEIVGLTDEKSVKICREDAQVST